MRRELSRRAQSDLDGIRDFSVRHLPRKSVHYPSDRRGLAMERNGDEVHLTEEEASGGEQPHIVRWVLGISLTLAVGLLSAVWIIGALTR